MINFKQRRINGLLVQLAGLRAEHAVAQELIRLTEMHYPAMEMQRAKYIGEIIEKLRQLGHTVSE